MKRVSELQDLVVTTAQLTSLLSLSEALVEELPTVTLSMEGAATLTVKVHDADRTLLRDPIARRRSWAEVGGARFELVRFAKSGTRVTLEFEDGIVAALDRVRAPLTIPAGTMSRAAIIARLCRGARVPYEVDFSDETKVRTPVVRSAHGSKRTSSRTVIGELAEKVKWRAFSDGHQMLVGPDAWLIARTKEPLQVREYTGPVHTIDFDLDVGRRASAASMVVDLDGWSLRPGGVVVVGDDMGPASGRWLVNEVSWPLGGVRGSVTLIRSRHALEEPAKDPDADEDPDKGDESYVPAERGVVDGATTGARERMVSFALAQIGKPFIRGGSGPAAYDAAGLLAAAAAAAGVPALPKPIAAQWATVEKAGRVVPVSVGLQTRGALLYRLDVDGYDHGAVSLGNDSTIEARGLAYGVAAFANASQQGWTGAAIWD